MPAGNAASGTPNEGPWWSDASRAALCVARPAGADGARSAPAAHDAVEVRAYVDDACIIADEPFFLPAPRLKTCSDQSNAKFLPLLGLVVGKLAELFINHAIQASADRIKNEAASARTRAMRWSSR